jgi:hypothetical protein
MRTRLFTGMIWVNKIDPPSTGDTVELVSFAKSHNTPSPIHFRRQKTQKPTHESIPL